MVQLPLGLPKCSDYHAWAVANVFFRAGLRFGFLYFVSISTYVHRYMHYTYIYTDIDIESERERDRELASGLVASQVA